MSWQILNSSVVITSSVPEVGTFSFSGVNAARIKKSIHSINQSCSLTIPSKAKFWLVSGGKPIPVTTGTRFADGDPIVVSLGYNGVMNEEFRGFVKRRDLAMPLVVECEGYERQLRLNTGIKYTSSKPITAKALLEKACEGTDITVQCDVDFNISGIRFVNFNGVQICDTIKEVSDHTLTIFFINPTTLWCGLPYTAYASGGGAKPASLTNGNKNVTGLSWLGFPSVGLELGWNTVKDNQLKQRIPSEPVQVLFKGKLATGALINQASRAKSALQKYQKLMSHVADGTTMGHFAQEKEFTLNYIGYQGKVTCFGVPFFLPGYDAYIVDSRYPELKGTYIIESTDVDFGVKVGFRRIGELGPLVGFNMPSNYSYSG